MKDKTRRAWFHIMAPLCAGLGFGMGISPIMKRANFLYFLVWVIVTIASFILYMARANYYKFRMEELLDEKNKKTKKRK